MKKLWLLLIIFVGAGWFILSLDGKADKNSGAKTTGTPVTVIKAYRTILSDDVEALGTAFANESVDITSNVTETLSTIMFDDGQLVKKGDIIAKLEQKEEQAQLSAADAQLAEHKRELKRIEDLLKNKAATKKSYDERMTLLEIAEQQQKEAKARIEDRTLRAPFDGVLGLRRISPGGLVQPGAVITTLDDIDPIKLDFNVPDIYLSSLASGVQIEADSESFGDKKFTGIIENVNSRVDPVTRSILVRAIIPNSDHVIKPGVLMHVTLLKNSRDSLVVPEEAIIQRQAKHLVYVIDQAKNEVQEKEVVTGARKPGIIEIKDGIKEGDLVIVRGLDNVSPGKTVDIKEIWDKARKPVPLNERPMNSPVKE